MRLIRSLPTLALLLPASVLASPTRVPASPRAVSSVRGAPVAPAASPRAADHPLRFVADTVVAEAPALPRATVIAADADWSHASRGGQLAVYGTSADAGRAAGEAGRAWLWPGARAIPVRGVDGRATSFSPDGRLLAVSSGVAPSRGPGGAFERARPHVTVLTVPDLREVFSHDGADPAWLSASSLAFREGTRAMRWDTLGGVRAASAAQPSFGCPRESFGPLPKGERCEGDVWTELRAVDPTLSRWLVEEASATSGYAAVREIDLVTGVSRTVASIPDWGRRAVMSLSEPSPSRSRVCLTHRALEPGQGMALYCAPLPFARLERVLSARWTSAPAWLDDDRFVVATSDGSLVVDLAAHTKSHLVGLPDPITTLEALPGGQRVAVTAGAPRVLDLARGTFTTFGRPGDRPLVEAVPGTDRRLLVRAAYARSPQAWVDL